LRKATIGANPLDSIIPSAQEPTATMAPTGLTGTLGTGGKERLTVHLTPDLIDRVKNAVYWTPGLTLAGLAQQAFSQVLAEIESERGEPFPPRREELKGGRPLK
jgi:hypothetical protein